MKDLYHKGHLGHIGGQQALEFLDDKQAQRTGWVEQRLKTTTSHL